MSKQSYRELKSLAKVQGIKGYYKMKKAELLKELKIDDSADTSRKIMGQKREVTDQKLLHYYCIQNISLCFELEDISASEPTCCIFSGESFCLSSWRVVSLPPFLGGGPGGGGELVVSMNIWIIELFELLYCMY